MTIERKTCRLIRGQYKCYQLKRFRKKRTAKLFYEKMKKNFKEVVLFSEKGKWTVEYRNKRS